MGGGYSQIRSELLLLKAATGQDHYDYYHLLSGEDLPIKPIARMHEFFERHAGREFIQIETAFANDLDRVRVRHYLQELCGRRTTVTQKRLFALQQTLVKVQHKFRLTRNEDLPLYRGTNWFSITDACARFALEHEKWIEKRFRYCYCGDELFLHTLLWNSGWQDRLFDACRQVEGRTIYGQALRLQDWSRPKKPHVWRLEDFDTICSDKEHMFARKFDALVDSEVITRVREYVLT